MERMAVLEAFFADLKAMNISKEDIALAWPMMQTQAFKKGAIILEKGAVCTHIHFIQEGITQNYLIAEKKKKVIWVSFPGEFCNALYSFYSRTPSEAIIEALIDTVVLSIHYDDLQKLYDQSKNWERFGRILAERSFIQVVREKRDVQFKDARQRYEELIEKRPELLQLLSLGQIANLLGISQETLSRIRAKR